MRKRTSLACLTLAACLALAGCGGAASAPSTSAPAASAASAAATPAATATPEPTATAEPVQDEEAKAIFDDLQPRLTAWLTDVYAREAFFRSVTDGNTTNTIGGQGGYLACAADFSPETAVYPCIDALFTPSAAQEQKDALMAEATREFAVEQGDLAPIVVLRNGQWYVAMVEYILSGFDGEAGAYVVTQVDGCYTIAVPTTAYDDGTRGTWYLTARQIDGVWYLTGKPLEITG